MSAIIERRPFLEVAQRGRKEFPGFSVEYFSQGKKLGTNEDKWVASPTMMGVVDGSTAKVPYTFNGVFGGEFASSTVASIVNTLESPLSGKELVGKITEKFHAKLADLHVDADLAKTPAARPSADFAFATLMDGKIMVTQLSDVGFWINGRDVYTNPIAIDQVHIAIRKEALYRLIEHGTDISKEEFLQRGLDSVSDSLQLQGEIYQNNPDHLFGYGVVDGTPVPEKFVKVYIFDASEVETIEFFSDGYFKVGDEPTIASWEKAFEEVEAEDPYKILPRYSAVKGSLPGVHLTDDRTLLIARFNKS